ncbi:hypothetical protein PEG84_12800 [Lactococcus lactis]|uniref:hypothetical protein n=1 Tax=Lactococcus lactis TaxID=1358 RepID=UPI0022DF567B|nr:hypothetical protein [Lactococcus lactis]MDA2899956.1 hypothetical protein [Lactococcus lactis]
MSENLKTIKELADELGVSKQNLQYHVKFLPTKKRQKNESGIVVLNIEEQMFISGRIKKNKAKDINDETKKGQKNINDETKKGQKNINDETKKRQKNNDVFAFNNHLLKEIIDLKEVNKQLLESQKQTQNLLDQQQRLALQDKKLLDEYKSEINDLKALKMPTQDTKVEQVSSKQPQEVESVAEEPKKAPRKWWKLW